MNDLIDFPCSDTWLDYYHSRGLTPRHSNRQLEEIQNLRNEVAMLRKEIYELRRLLKFALGYRKPHRKKVRKVALPEE